jgi:DNA polymerase-1
VECIIPLNLRDSFVAQPGMVFVSADYSQLEMRLLAHISQEAALLQFFSDGHDFFKLVGRYHSPPLFPLLLGDNSPPPRRPGSRLWGKPSAQVDEKERELAKRVCYGVMYGAGKALPSTLACSLAADPSDPTW